MADMMTLYCDESDDGEIYALAGWWVLSRARVAISLFWRQTVFDQAGQADSNNHGDDDARSEKVNQAKKSIHIAAAHRRRRNARVLRSTTGGSGSFTVHRMTVASRAFVSSVSSNKPCTCWC